MVSFLFHFIHIQSWKMHVNIPLFGGGGGGGGVLFSWVLVNHDLIHRNRYNCRIHSRLPSNSWSSKSEQGAVE